MSRRIAQRPRYRSLHLPMQHPRNPRQTFFRTRWTYRRQQDVYEKHPLGYRLSLVVPPSYYHLTS